MDELEERKAAKLSKWMAKANEAISISLVHDPKEGKGETFHPEYTHQIFGDEETIKGYSNLSIKIHFSASSLQSCIQINYKDEYKGSEFTPNDIIHDLAEWIPAGFTTNYDEFLRRVEEDQKFEPIGEQFHEYTLENQPNKKYILTKGTLETPRLKEFHKRIETFSIFEIDGARLLDDDSRWQFVYLFEKETIGGESRMSTIGYCTIYPFFCYPDSKRPRISQFMILPPYQRKGHGSKMYEAIFLDLLRMKDVVDIPVEDPAESFQQMRTICDLKYLQSNKLIEDSPLKVYLDKERLKALQKKSKLSPRQTQICLEILALKELKPSQKEEKKQLRLSIKRRFFKDDQDIGGLEKPDRYAKLQELFEQEVDRHRKILNSLA